MKILLASVFFIFFLMGCSETIQSVSVNTSQSDQGANLSEKVNVSQQAIFAQDSCMSENYEAERDCYITRAYAEVNPGVCEGMPEDVNERQGNKAFCLGFMAAVMGRVELCREQPNLYYKNVCTIMFERYFFDSAYFREFEELKKQYGNKDVESPSDAVLNEVEEEPEEEPEIDQRVLEGEDLNDAVRIILAESCDASCLTETVDFIKRYLKKRCLGEVGSNVIQCVNSKLLKLQELKNYENYDSMRTRLKQLCYELSEFGIADIYEGRCLSDWVR